MPRFFLSIPDDEQVITIVGADARHIAGSLRMRPGDSLTVCNGHGTDFACVITAADNEQVVLEVTDRHQNRSEPTVEITLYQGLPKGDKLEWIIQKAVELGVTRIVPVVTARSIAKSSSREDQKTARRQKIADEAAGQSGRGILPAVEPPISFGEAIARIQKERTVVFYECGGAPLSTLLTDKPEKLSLFIGPEGGIAPEEIEKLTAAGAKTATLGPRILRCETAPLAALTAVMTLTGNMDS